MAKSKMKFISKLLCLTLVLVFGLGILCACNKDDNYHAVIDDNVTAEIKWQFMQENLSYSPDGKTAEDKCFIIQTQDEFDEIFYSHYQELKNINLNKQTVILKVVGSCTSYHRCKLSKISKENSRLTVNCYYDCPVKNEDCEESPYIRYVALIMDKTCISEVNFSIISKQLL